MFLPKSCADTTVYDPDSAAEVRRRRARCKIPGQGRHREKWRLALDMLDQPLGTADRATHGGDASGGWGLAKLPVVSDSAYGDVTEFRLGLTKRGLSSVVSVKPTTSAQPVDTVPTDRRMASRRARPH